MEENFRCISFISKYYLDLKKGVYIFELLNNVNHNQLITEKGTFTRFLIICWQKIFT